MPTGYYRIFQRYILKLAASFFCGLGLAVCIVAQKAGADWATESVVLSVFAGLLVLVLAFLHLLHFRKCPTCGKRSLKLDCDPANIVSTAFATRHFYVHCRHCGHFEYTDLGLKSNIFIKAIPVRMKPGTTGNEQ